MLMNLLDVAMPTLPIIIISMFDDPVAVFLLAVIGIALLSAVIAIFYSLHKKKKRSDTVSKNEQIEKIKNDSGENND